MKLIIKIDDDIAKGIRGENECEVEPREIVRSFQATIAEAIKNATPYNSSGDCISREALKEQKVYSRELHKYVVPVCDIDKAQAVEQDWRFYYNHGYKQAERDLKRQKGVWTFDEKGYFYCDQCGKYPRDQHSTTDFCPKCGADMRKGGAE